MDGSTNSPEEAERAFFSCQTNSNDKVNSERNSEFSMSGGSDEPYHANAKTRSWFLKQNPQSCHANGDNNLEIWKVKRNPELSYTNGDNSLNIWKVNRTHPADVGGNFKVWKPRNKSVSTDRKFEISDRSLECVKELQSEVGSSLLRQDSVEQSSVNLAGEELPIEQEMGTTNTTKSSKAEVKSKTCSKYTGYCSDEPCYVNGSTNLKSWNAKRNPKSCPVNQNGNLKTWKAKKNSESCFAKAESNVEALKVKKNFEPCHANGDRVLEVCQLNRNSESCPANMCGDLEVWKVNRRSKTCPTNGKSNLEVLKLKKNLASCQANGDGNIEACNLSRNSESCFANVYCDIQVWKLKKNSELCPTNSESGLEILKLKKNLKSFAANGNDNLELCQLNRNSKSCAANVCGEVKVWKPKNNPVSTGPLSSDNSSKISISDESLKGVKPLKSERSVLLPFQNSVEQSSVDLVSEQLCTKPNRNTVSGTNSSNTLVKCVAKSESSTESCPTNGESKLEVKLKNNPASCHSNGNGNLEACNLSRNSGPCSANVYSDRQVWKVKMNSELCPTNGESGLEILKLKNNLGSSATNGNGNFELCKLNRTSKSSAANVYSNLKVWKPKNNHISMGPLSNDNISKIYVSDGSLEGVKPLKSERSVSLPCQNSVKQSFADSVSEKPRPDRNTGSRTNSSNTWVKCVAYSESSNDDGSIESCHENGDGNLEVWNSKTNLRSSHANGDDNLKVRKMNMNTVSCPANLDDCHQVWKPKTTPVSVDSVLSNFGRNFVTSNGSLRGVKPLRPELDALLPCQNSAKQSSLEADASQHGKLEKFLFYMFGPGFQLERVVIREVLGSCSYDMKQSINKLLDLAAESLNSKYKLNQGRRIMAQQSRIDTLTASRYRTSYAKGNRLKDSNQQGERYQQTEDDLTALLKVPDMSQGSGKDHIVGAMSRYKTSDNLVIEPVKDIVDEERHVESTSLPDDEQDVAFDDSYHILRQTAKEFYSIMKKYYRSAAEAFAKDDVTQAIMLMEKGKYFFGKAREADEESARRTLQMSGTEEENQDGVTLDLQNLSAKEAIRIIKCHLQALCGISCFGCLRITNGNEGDTLKESRKRRVTKFLLKESIKWREEDGDPGTILVCLDEIHTPHHLSFAGNNQ